MIVYLDGENTVFQIMDALKRTRHITSRDALLNLDLTALIRLMIGRTDVTIKYYTTTLQELKDADPELEKRSKDIIAWTAKWTNHLTEQGINVIKAGKLKTREGITCRNCGHKETIFIEKGVDVRLAVDLLVDSETDKMLIIWSSDADLVPAIQVVKDRGARVKYLTHVDSLNWALARSAEEWQTYTDEQLLELFDKSVHKAKVEKKKAEKEALQDPLKVIEAEKHEHGDKA